MSAQSEGNYAEALQNYYEAMRLEIDPYDRSYILYNIGLIHTSNGEHTKALLKITYLLPFVSGLGLTRMVGTTNIHLVRTLDTRITIEDC